MARILLVEDERWLAELYASLLEKSGHEVICCEDNYEAIGRLVEPLPATIVLDLLLPWTNGIQLLHELASYTDLTQIPIILCSSAVTSDLTVDSLRPYGVVAILDKATMVPRDIIKTVERVIHANIS